MNPFRDIIVSDPWRSAAADVPEIQARIFHECLQGIEQVRQTHRSAALLIHGGAGAGKTHLLGRLRAQLTLTAPTATDRDECLFVWVRLQASPRMIWRHVRRTLVEDWFRPVRGQSTQFARILFHRFAEIRIAEGDLEPWYEYMLDHHPEGLEELLERISVALHLDRNTTIAFKHLAFGRHTRDLRAWLAGDSLPEAALERLDLSQEDGTDEEREHEARRVVLMLCRLAGDGLPIVLSLDQVEALQTSSTDREGLFSFGQLVSTLHDETSNVLLISCIQSSFATELKDKSRGADYDRMTSLGALSLATLTRAEAEKLIAVRRAQCDVPLPPEPRDPLWPLEAADFHRLSAIDELTPRRLLSTCAERFAAWEAAQGTSSTANLSSGSDAVLVGSDGVDQSSLSQFLDSEWKRRAEQHQATNQPEQTEEILRHGLPLLFQVLKQPWTWTSDEGLPDVQMIAAGPTGRVGFAICVQANMRNAGETLKRLRTQFNLSRLASLVILQDERVPLTRTAKVARQTLDDLQQEGAQLIVPSTEVLISLDVVRDLLSDSKAGDLEFHGVTVTDADAQEWLATSIPPALRQLVTQLAELSISE